MMKAAWVLLTIISTSYVACDAYKILVIFPLPGKSHSMLGNALVQHLLKAGHEVTFITSVLNKKSHPNLQEIDVTSNWDLIPDGIFKFEKMINGELDVSNQWLLFLLFHMMTTTTLRHPNVQELLEDRSQKFDLVIAEWMFSELYSGFSVIFDAPFVWFSTVEPHGMILNLVDEYINTAYNAYFVDSATPLSFKNRAYEFWLTIKYSVFRETVLRALQIWHYRQIMVPHIEARGKVAPSLEELKYNASLVIGNSHVSLGQPIRLPQAYKSIGGYHIPDEVQPLPDDIKKVMDNSKDGVIFFSMGSNLQSKDLPEEIKTQILELFGNLKQTVFWKFEEKLPNTPKNVHILEWAPQHSILAHPNCVLFITHGGLLSTTETVHYGVPIIGIPVFADQFINVNRAVSKGFAKRVDLSYTMGNDLKEAINDILTDPKYTQRVKQLSFIYHDRPVKPSVELVHWVEHVINTGGAPHLRSPALHVSWYQKAYLDLALVIAALVYVLRKFIKFLSPSLFPKKHGVKLKSN